MLLPPTAGIIFLLNLLAAMVWVGGMVAVTVSTIAARATLEPGQQVQFFRALGRRWAIVSGVALGVFAVTGLLLAGEPGSWTGTEVAVAALTAAVALLTVAGVRNARAVQRLRAQALAEGDVVGGDGLRRARQTANVLRGLIAAVTLAAVLTAAL